MDDQTITFNERDGFIFSVVSKKTAQSIELPGFEGRVSIIGIGGDYYKIIIESTNSA